MWFISHVLYITYFFHGILTLVNIEAVQYREDFVIFYDSLAQNKLLLINSGYHLSNFVAFETIFIDNKKDFPVISRKFKVNQNPIIFKHFQKIWNYFTTFMLREKNKQINYRNKSVDLRFSLQISFHLLPNWSQIFKYCWRNNFSAELNGNEVKKARW